MTTRTLALDTSRIERQSRLGLAETSNTETFYLPGNEAFYYASNRSSTSGEWHKQIKQAATRAIVSMYLDFAHLTNDTGAIQTGAIDVGCILNALRPARRITARISPSLRTTREKMLASSFIAPSGARLTWMQISKEPVDDGE